MNPVENFNPSSSADNSIEVTFLETDSDKQEQPRETAEELFKKMADAASGLLHLAKGQIEKVVSDLAEKRGSAGAEQQSRGTRMNVFWNEAEKTKEVLEVKLRDIAEKFASRMDGSSAQNRDKEISELRERLQKLEEMLNNQGK